MREADQPGQPGETNIGYYRRIRAQEARAAIARAVRASALEGQPDQGPTAERLGELPSRLTGVIESGSFIPGEAPIAPGAKLDWPFD